MWCSSGGGWGRRVTTSSTTTTTWSGGGGPKTSDITDIGTTSNAGSGWLLSLEMLLAWCAWCDVVACHFLIFEFCELRCDGWRTFWDGHLDLIQSKAKAAPTRSFLKAPPQAAQKMTMRAVTPLLVGQWRRWVAFWKALELLYRLRVESASLNDFLPIDPVKKGVR